MEYFAIPSMIMEDYKGSKQSSKTAAIGVYGITRMSSALYWRLPEQRVDSAVVKFSGDCSKAKSMRPMITAGRIEAG